MKHEIARKNHCKRTGMLSIIIVNYNGACFLEKCLYSITRHVGCSHEVIIVDNASTDGSRELIRTNFPTVRLIESSINLGYAAGNNLGVAAAQGNLLLLLNNDTILLSSLIPAVQRFERETKLGVLGCRMEYGDGRLQTSIGFEATPLRFVLSWTGVGHFNISPNIFRRVEMDEHAYSRVHNHVAWVSGAFLMTRTSVWRILKGMDQGYFMYVEDTDYCKRARLAGWSVAYTPEVEIIHYEGSGKEWIGPDALKNAMRSYFIYIRRFYRKPSALFVWLGLSIVMTARSFAFSLRSTIDGSDVALQKSKAYKELTPRLLLNYMCANKGSGSDMMKS